MAGYVILDRVMARSASFYLCGVSSLVYVQAACESQKCLAFLFGTEVEFILAAEHKHELSWLCLGLHVYVANCKLTCYGV